MGAGTREMPGAFVVCCGRSWFAEICKLWLGLDANGYFPAGFGVPSQSCVFAGAFFFE